MCGVTTIVANNRIEIRPRAGSNDRSTPAPTCARPTPGQAWLRLAFLGAGLALVAAGCSPFQLAHRTLHGELNEFPRLTDGRASCRLYKQWALQEWAQIADGSPEAFSDDYESGFLQGFIDHVYAGGRLVPPPMPPRRYWRLPYRNAQGQLAIREWYAGFEHGARVAHENGYRDRAVIPTSLLPGGEGQAESSPGDEWIEFDPVAPAEELPSGAGPTPAVPVPPPADPAPAPPPTDVPAAEPTTGTARKLTPGGLPIPDDAPTTLAAASSRPRASAAEPAPSAGSPSTSNRSSGTPGGPPPANASAASGPKPAVPGQASQGTQPKASGLPLEPATEGPPHPPWIAKSATDSPSGSSHVRLASAHTPTAGEASPLDADTTGGINGGPSTAGNPDSGFDPFAGTRFAELSTSLNPSDGALAAQSPANEPPKGTPVTAAQGSGSVSTAERSGAWVAARTEPPATRDALPTVKPLDAIVPLPGKSLATLTWPDGSGTTPKSPPTAEAAPDEHKPDRRSSGPVDVDMTNSAGGQAPREAADVPPAEALPPGWQPVRPESSAEWKEKGKDGPSK